MTCLAWQNLLTEPAMQLSAIPALLQVQPSLLMSLAEAGWEPHTGLNNSTIAENLKSRHQTNLGGISKTRESIRKEWKVRNCSDQGGKHCPQCTDTLFMHKLQGGFYSYFIWWGSPTSVSQQLLDVWKLKVLKYAQNVWSPALSCWFHVHVQFHSECIYNHVSPSSQYFWGNFPTLTGYLSPWCSGSTAGQMWDCWRG